MKKPISAPKTLLPFALAVASLLAASGCSTLQGQKSASDLSASGPTVVQAKAEPSTVKLNTALSPTQPANVYADVMDFNSKVKSVSLRFVHVPITLQMHPLTGTTWQATVPPADLKKLAVSGQTMRYDVEVIAKNAKGQVAVSTKPLEISVKTPEASELTG